MALVLSAVVVQYDQPADIHATFPCQYQSSTEWRCCRSVQTSRWYSDNNTQPCSETV